MAVVIVTLKVMPEDPEINLEELRDKAEKIIADFGGRVTGDPEEEPVGFGLKAVILRFSVDESKGSPDPVAEKIEEMEGVRSAQVTMVSRALG
ncbi:elongation factor 1-beta [Candidatus Woesearchaeota archaeon]|nr:elongation factor 1-beta [Candidatus Woesearchaeota archaeon]